MMKKKKEKELCLRRHLVQQQMKMLISTLTSRSLDYVQVDVVSGDVPPPVEGEATDQTFYDDDLPWQTIRVVCHHD
jgi:hypothetical protein